MILLGGLAAGVCAFFAVGLAIGKAPTLRFGNTNGKPATSKRQIWLRQAGLDLTPTQYYATLSAIGFVVFAVVSVLTATPAVALVPATIAVVIPHAFFSKRRGENLASTRKAWPDAIREIIGSIESNSSLQSALVQLSQKGPEALREPFERFPAMSATLGMVPALEAIRERMADPTSDRVIEVLILAHERGGGIVTDILRDLAIATTDDLQLDQEIETSRLEQKINARVVFVIPWLVLILLVISNDQFREFYQTSLGTVVVIAGGCFSLFGIFIVSRLFRDPPEIRVFGGSAISNSAERMQS